MSFGTRKKGSRCQVRQTKRHKGTDKPRDTFQIIVECGKMGRLKVELLRIDLEKWLVDRSTLPPPLSSADSERTVAPKDSAT